MVGQVNDCPIKVTFAYRVYDALLLIAGCNLYIV